MTRTSVRTYAALVAVPLSLTFLVGCTPELPPNPAIAQDIVAPVLTAEQSSNVAAAAGEVLAASDAEKDAKLLEPRVTGPALDLRTAEYKIAKSTKDDKSITELPSIMQSIFLTTSTTWPRTMYAVSERPQNLEPERLMVYTQESAREDYDLWAYLTLFPGITVPTFASIDTGTTEVTDADESLQMKPTQALEAYAELLKSSSKENKEKFDLEKDTFYTTIGDRRKTLKDAAEQIEGTYKESFKVGESWKALRTLDGGALVVGTIETTGTLKGEEGAIVTPSALEKAFLKKDQKASNALSVKRTAVVAVYVPAKENAEAKPMNIGRLIRTTGASVPK